MVARSVKTQKEASLRATFLLLYETFQLLCSHCHVLMPGGNTLRRVFGNQGLDADVRDYKT